MIESLMRTIQREREREGLRKTFLKERHTFQDNAILCMKKSVKHNNNNNRNNSFSTVLILVYSLSSEGKITLMNEDTRTIVEVKNVKL